MITTIGEIVRGDAAVFPPYLYEAYRSTIRRAPHHALVEVPLTLSERTGPGPVSSESVSGTSTSGRVGARRIVER